MSKIKCDNHDCLNETNSECQLNNVHIDSEGECESARFLPLKESTP